VWQLLDLGAFGLPLAQAIGRWGNFANRELEGIATNLPWAITDAAGDRRHPLFLYESLLNLILFLCLLALAKRANVKSGIILASYLIGYGLIRLILEALRPVEIVWVWQGFPVAQIFSLLAIIVGFALLLRRSR
jgi:phosphatidylglycerol:prolipoprotein diacylglycerol transferase